MSCYHPKKAFVLGINPDTNKKILKITEYDVKYLVKYKNSSKFLKVYDESFCANSLNCCEKYCTYKCDRFKRRFDDDDRSTYYFDFINIPCGQCIGCRLEYSRQWACRMMLELPYSSSSYFITLTYDDEHVPESEFLDNESGELLYHKTLCKRDLQLFNKRLRKHYGEGIRFYACGEYGSNSFRPHYHSIYFNLPISDLEFFMRSPSGFNYYRSKTIDKLWNKGYTLICDVTFETCAYVSRYVTKKVNGAKKSDFERLGIQPEFSLMSRRPGIGRRWFDEHGRDAFKTYIITVSTSNGGLRFKPPSYYDRLYDGLEPLRMAEIKEKNRFKAESITRLKLDNTDKDFLGMLEDEEFNFQHNPKNKYGLLKRKDF